MKDHIVKREICGMGLSPRHKGFYYLSRAIGEMASSEKEPCDVQLWAYIDADHSRADRCMRYAIRYAWDVNNGAIHGLFPEAALPPSPVEFAHAMLWHFAELSEKRELEERPRGK